MRYTARAPLRIDLAGGWTDVPIFAEREGGCVVNAAITCYVHGTLSRPSATGWAARWRSDRTDVHYWLDVPAGSGLGSSAAQTVLWTALVRTSIKNTMERAEVAETAWSIGNLLGILGGKQDEYASALGGFNVLTCGDSVRAERLSFDESFLTELRSRLVLVYSGKSRLSGAIHESVWGAYEAGDDRVVSALRTLKSVANAMKNALLSRDIEGLATLVNDNWTAQQMLHESVTNTDLDALITYGRQHGAIAAKACGAGGGGCVLFVTAPEAGARLRAALAARRHKPIDFDFDTYGVRVGRGYPTTT